MDKQEFIKQITEQRDFYYAMNPIKFPNFGAEVFEYQKEMERRGELDEPIIAVDAFDFVESEIPTRSLEGPTPFEPQDPSTFPPKSVVKEPLEMIWFEDIKPKLESRGLTAGLEAGPCGFRFDDELGYLDIYWGGYEYSIALDRINTQENLIGLLYHVSGKGWAGYSAINALALIDACTGKFGWRKWL